MLTCTRSKHVRHWLVHTAHHHFHHQPTDFFIGLAPFLHQRKGGILHCAMRCNTHSLLCMSSRTNAFNAAALPPSLHVTSSIHPSFHHTLSLPTSVPPGLSPPTLPPSLPSRRRTARSRPQRRGRRSARGRRQPTRTTRLTCGWTGTGPTRR